MDLLQAQHLLVRDACEAFDSREGFARFRLPAHVPAEMAADLFRRQSSSNEPDRDQSETKRNEMQLPIFVKKKRPVYTYRMTRLNSTKNYNRNV